MGKLNDLSRYTVLILGAGLGTRLRPLTDHLPKVMLPIGGRPLLEHAILNLRDQGFKNFIVNVHYLPEKITAHFGDGSAFGVTIRYSDESEKLMDTGGAIRKVADRLGDRFVLVYGDQLHRFDFRPVIEFHENNMPIGTVVLKRSDLPQNGDLAEVNKGSMKIEKWHERPHDIKEFGENLFLNAGLYVFSKEIVNFIPHGPVHLDREVIPTLIREGREMYGFLTDEDILDIGTPEKYVLASQWFEKTA